MSENENNILKDKDVIWEKPLVKGKDAYIDGFGYINDPDNEDFKLKLKKISKSGKNLITVERDTDGFVTAVGLSKDYINLCKERGMNFKGSLTEQMLKERQEEEKRKKELEVEREKVKENGRVIIEKFLKEKKLENSINLMKFTNSFSGNSKHRCVYQIVGENVDKIIVGNVNEIKDDILYNIQKNDTMNIVDSDKNENSVHA